MSWHIRIAVTLADFKLEFELTTTAKRVAIIGANGSGKTTLLKTIVGAYAPSTGVIQVATDTLFCADTSVNERIENRRVGYVPQGFALFPHLTVTENLLYGRNANHDSAPSRLQSAMALLRQMGCEALANERPELLSMGQRQRVALARALMISPRCVLLDEPLSALDPSARRQLRTFLAQRLFESAAPSLIVTHDQRDVFALSDYVCVLDKGRVVQQGTPTQVMQSPANDFVSEFFDGAPTS